MRVLIFSLVFALCFTTKAIAQVPSFKMQEIDRGLKIGYAVIVEDLDGDKHPDIVVVDQLQIAFYQNPGSRDGVWKKHVILDGQTIADNVCITAMNIVGDELPELVIGAGWKPFDTLNAGQLVWLERNGATTEPWIVHQLPSDEPTVHRVRSIDINGDGRKEIVQVPLMGRGATKQANWTDGRPLAIVAMEVPQGDPRQKENWKPIVLNQELNVAHNFCVATPPYAPSNSSRGSSILAASYAGVSLLAPSADGTPWKSVLLHPANQANPSSNRGASEIKQSSDGRGLIATIEPWHGNQVVVYTPATTSFAAVTSVERQVLDEQLRWGHAVNFADLNADGLDELIIGVRDDPNAALGDTFAERRGVRIYQSRDKSGEQWDRIILDEGGVAVEDLTTADLDSDGRIDIIAVGRQTGNARIYWNQDSKR